MKDFFQMVYMKEKVIYIIIIKKYMKVIFIKERGMDLVLFMIMESKAE